MTYRTLVLLALVFTLPLGASAAVSYSSIVDASATEALFDVRVLGEEEPQRFRCTLQTATCEVVEGDTSLVPDALRSETFYYISQANDRAVITQFVPNRTPEHTLYDIQNGELISRGKLPITMDISRVRFPTNGTTLIITQVDGVTVKYDIASGVSTPITALPSGASWVSVSPDGRYIAYYQAATLSRGTRTFGVVDTTLNKTYTFDETVAYWDLLTEGTTMFAFSPDSTKLVYLSDRSGYPTLYLVRLNQLGTSSMAGEQIITREYSVGEFIWRDNATILFSANREHALTWSLYAYTPSTGALTKIADDISYDSEFIRAGTTIILNRIVGDTRVPYVYQTSIGMLQELKLPGIAPTDRTQGEAVRAGTLNGVWLKPQTAGKTLLVWLHGGPYRQSSLGYHPYFSYAGYDWILSSLADAGTAVLKLDYPGSHGYGRAFAESITGQVGVRDVATTIAAVRSFATEHGYTDIYVAGNSYGGYLALKLLAEYPENLEGAFSINGVTDWDTLTRSLQTSIFNVQFNGVRGMANDALYANASIIDNLEALDGEKIVIAHGNADRTVPYRQSALLADLLEGEDIDHEFLTYEDEDHVYAREQTFESLCEELFSFTQTSERNACSL